MPKLLDIENLQVEFNTDNGTLRAVDGVSLEIAKGETLGLVGESGSGKSVTSMAIMGLVPDPPGKILDGKICFRGRDLIKEDDAEMSHLRGDRIAMIFQDPMTSLNPFLTIGLQLTEVMYRHDKGVAKIDAWRRAVKLLDDVGITAPDRRMKCYPHELSGGMRQRVMIAMALMMRPDLLIADEPTTALDVTIQAQILDLLTDLQERRGMAVMLITHDLGVVAGHCNRVAVMYAGKIVEHATVDKLFASPRHPYTRGLIESIPRLDEEAETRLTPIVGQPPDLVNRPSGCPFHPRCRWATDVCRQSYPDVTKDPADETHYWSCHVSPE